MPLTYVTVTGTFDDGSGTPLSGQATFIPSATVYAAGIPLVTEGVPVNATIINGLLKNSSGGALTLLATDNTGLTVEGLTGFWFWTVTLTIGGTTQGWSFFLPKATSPVELFALANTQAGGGGFTNPMTTLGDLIYENATPAAARLAGDTSNTRKFLRTQAAAGIAQAPAWDTIAAGDLPAATTSVQGAVIVDGTAADIQPDGVQAAGATGKAADAGHIHPYQAWQFTPEAYGAKGDGKVIADAVLASNTTLTSATAGFTSGDTGKWIMINGGQGSAAIPLITTITYVNATTVTLGSAASVSGTGFAAVYGTDDTAAVNSAVTAAKTYALAHQYFAEVVFAAKIYVLATGPTQSGNGSSTPTFNAQIPLPYPNAAGTSQKLVISLAGAGDSGFFQFWESTVPNVAGTALVSMLTSAPSTPDATFGNQSVIGGPSGAAGFTGGFANTKAVIRGIQVISPAYTNQYAYDFGYLAGMRITQSSAHIFAPTGVNGGNGPLLKDLPAQGGFQNKIGAGLRAPVIGNNADVTADDFSVEGYSRALYVFDHFTAGRIGVIYADVALKIDLTQGLSGNSHGISIALLNAEVYNGGISVSGNTYCPVYINLDAECTGPAYDISDSGNALRGEVHWTDPADTRAPVVTGAANLRVINDKLGPGQWTGAMTPAVPAVPATTVAQVNTSYRDATVYLTSGGAAVTVIKVDAVTTGLTLGTSGTVAVRVPAGHSITLTYASTAPTWVWVLD